MSRMNRTINGYESQPRRVIIGLNGQPRVGKDTLCSLLQQVGEDEGLTVKRVAFADALKAEVEAEYGVPEGTPKDAPLDIASELNERLGLTTIKTYRHLLIAHSTLMKQKDPARYIRPVVRELAKGDYDVAVVTDMGFIEEHIALLTLAITQDRFLYSPITLKRDGMGYTADSRKDLSLIGATAVLRPNDYKNFTRGDAEELLDLVFKVY